MSPEIFTYWLQGFVELTETDSDACTLSDKQWLVIKDHLKLVFDKKTPDRLEYKNPNYQELIDAIRPKPVDLIGKQFDWMTNTPKIIC